MNIDTEYNTAISEFAARLRAIEDLRVQIAVAVAHKREVAPIQERVEELADAALEALRWADRATVLEKLR